MFEFIKKWKQQTILIDAYRSLLEHNQLFLDTLLEDDALCLFEYLKTHSSIVIQDNLEYHYEYQLNTFYNNFFQQYKTITIGDTVNISSDFIKISDHFYPLISIGQEYLEWIYVKKNSVRNGLFFDNNELKQSIENEESHYQDIYYYLLSRIGQELSIDLKAEYEKMISNVDFKAQSSK